MLASLEGARFFLEEARESVGNIINNILKFKTSLSSLSNFEIGVDTAEPQDPLKLCVASPMLTGKQLAELLQERYSIYPELATDEYILFILGLTEDNTNLENEVCFNRDQSDDG